MKSKFLAVVFVGILLLVSSCSSPDLPDSQPGSSPLPVTSTNVPTELSPQPSQTPAPLLTPTSSGENQETPPISLQRPAYDISLVVDYTSRTAEVKQTIRLPHPGSQPLDELVLMVPPNDWPDVFQLEEIRREGDPDAVNYDLEGVTLSILFSDPWLPGEEQTLQLSYDLKLPAQNARAGYGPSPFGYTELQTNLVDWYAVVPPYQEGEGWLVHKPWRFGEYLVYPASDFKVSLQISNGPEVVVAASGPAVRDGTVRTYRLEEARNFVFSLSPSYQVFEGKVGETTVLGYHFPGYTNSGQAAFQTTMEALELYQELYGPYQQETISMVQGDFNHGMEYEGMYYLSRAMFDSYNGTPESYLVLIAAHETAHQWWYGQVANDQALEPWLDESLCTFSELIFYENTHPQAVDWWWAARIDYYQPEGRIDGSIYDFAVPGGNNYEDYRQAIYLRGAEFQHQLREELGEERYYRFLAEYAAEYSNQVASGDDFFRILDNYIEVDTLAWLGEFFVSKQ